MHKQFTKICTLFLFTHILLSTLCVGLAENEGEKRQNPFTPKAFAIRYWDRSIHNNLPKPEFILSKVSPLSAADAGTFEELAVANTLSTQLPEFCSAAHLVCFPNVAPSLTEHPNSINSSVQSNDQNFTALNDALMFVRYNRNSASHDTNSAVYSDNQNFTALNNALMFVRYNHQSASHDTNSAVASDNQNLTALNDALMFVRYNRNSASHDTNSVVDSDNQNLTALNEALMFVRYNRHSASHDTNSAVDSDNQNLTALNDALMFVRYNRHSASHDTNSVVDGDNQNFTALNNALMFVRYNRNSPNHDTNSVVDNDNQNFTALNNALMFVRYNRHSTSHDTNSAVDSDDQNFTALNDALMFVRYNRNSASHDTNSAVDSVNQNLTALNDALMFVRYNRHSASHDTNSAVDSDNQNLTALNDALMFVRYNRHSASHDTNSVVDGDNQNVTALNNSLLFVRYNRNSPSHDTNFAVDSDNQNFTTLNNSLLFVRYNRHSASHDTNSSVDSDNQNITSVAEGPNAQVQPGMFFREMMLKEGNIIPMPDIRDKLQKRSFLPRSILTKLPFSSSKLNDVKHIFRVTNNSFMEKVIVNTLSECEWPANRGEIKQCVGSLEDMIDFATYILGRNVTVRSTENVNGSNKNVVVGQVKEISGGKAPQFVACHQILFPYLLYYCHSVPKVRVYEVDLLDLNSKSKINHGVVVCHLDTTAWSPTHNAFLALGFGPGRIEVCHWVFENNLIWTNAH